MTLTTMGHRFATLPPPIDKDHDRPYVIKPDGTTEDYTRISAFAKSLDNAYGIALWKMRWLCIALTRRPDLLNIVAGLRYEDKGHMEKLDQIMDTLLDYVGTTAKANYGTAIHLLTEPDAGDPEHVPTQMRLDAFSYRSALDPRKLKVVATELTVVNDDLKIAGHLDHIYEHPDYGRIVGDKKTGRLSQPYFSIQLACYANSYIYDGTSERKPLDVNLDWGLIPYIPAGKGECRFIPTNIRYGWRLTAPCATARDAWSFKDWYGPDLEPDEMAQATDNLVKGGLIGDPITAAIGAALSYEELLSLHAQNKDAWTEEHTALAVARKTYLTT